MLPIDSDESVDDFEIDSDDENEIETVSAENEIALDANDFTCQYWSSDEGSEDSSSSSTEDSDDDTFSQSSFETDRLASLNTSARDGVSTSHVHKPKAFQPAPEPNSPATDSLIPFGTLHQWSIDKDWALVKVTISAESPISTFLAANPEDLSTLEMARPSSSKASVIVNTTSNGRLTGTVTGTTSDTRVPFGTSFQEVFSVQLNGPLADGDCGSVVIDASTGTLYGHIVSGCRATGFAQVMAAFHTMPELQKTSPVADTTVTGEDQTDICATVNFDLPLSGPSQSFLPNLDGALVCFLCASTPFSAMPPFEHASLFSNAEFPSIETPAVTLHRLSRRACVNRRHVAISPSQEINTDRRRIFTRTTQVRTWFKKNIKRDSRIGGYQQLKEVLLLRWGDPKDYVHKQEMAEIRALFLEKFHIDARLHVIQLPRSGNRQKKAATIAAVHASRCEDSDSLLYVYNSENDFEEQSKPVKHPKRKRLITHRQGYELTEEAVSYTPTPSTWHTYPAVTRNEKAQ
ncbi:hypothetical protein N0V91_002384 [Didymella pomorum]|uniref:Uncharacterized protein n=1 Tax=Didymella pomorum TaxID=749634 RepID=A0A9W8ZIX0_9PLEO|nr:hypothetical protein N0V91_002384 [Didymella pomorum]